jgi:hypothetical protein
VNATAHRQLRIRKALLDEQKSHGQNLEYLGQRDRHRFFAAMTVVFDLWTIVFLTHTRVPIPDTMVFAIQTIFLIRETIVPVAKNGES